MNTNVAVTCLPLRLIGLCLLALLVFGANGCAVFYPENHPCYSFVEEAIEPQSTGAKIALYPVGFVAGTAATTVDAGVVTPARMFVKTCDFTATVWGKVHKAEMPPFRKSLLYTFSGVATPPCFAIAWVFNVLMWD